MAQAPVIDGYVAAGFAPVADAFRDNFVAHGEVGAAFCAYVEGRPVVDIWGGEADPRDGRAWSRDTLQTVFSGTKGLVAGCLLLLLDDGALEIDHPVSDYWPEFAAAGKSAITVGDVVSHRGGLPAIDVPLTVHDALDPVRMAVLLARQRPRRHGDGQVAYHPLTYGWLCDGLVRRVTGTSLADLFSRRIAQPLDLEAWIGISPSELDRVSQLCVDSFAVAAPLVDREFGGLIYDNPPVWREPLVWNTEDYRLAQIPGAGGIASARAMARYYACLAEGGTLDGPRIWSPDVIRNARQPLSDGRDPYFDHACRYGVGFELQTASTMFLGPVREAFGHPGAGGSTHGAWPDTRVGFSYCMNLMRDDGDARGRRILRALATTLDLE